jgi:hypothetical protein
MRSLESQRGSWATDQPFQFGSQLDEVLRNNELARRSLEKYMVRNPAFQNNPSFPRPRVRRFYMAGAARFLTAVREAEWLAGENPYGYAHGNPTRYTDPSGNSPATPKCKSTTFPPACKPQWLDMIIKYMDQYCDNCPNLNYQTLQCQMWAESNCVPGSHTGSNWGLFQISKDIWDEVCSSLGPFQPTVTDPQSNIECAIMLMCTPGYGFYCDGPSKTVINQLAWGTKSGIGSDLDTCMKCWQPS